MQVYNPPIIYQAHSQPPSHSTVPLERTPSLTWLRTTAELMVTVGIYPNQLLKKKCVYCNSFASFLWNWLLWSYWSQPTLKQFHRTCYRNMKTKFDKSSCLRNCQLSKYNKPIDEGGERIVIWQDVILQVCEDIVA